MQMTIYDAATVGSRSNCVYPNPVTVTDADTMRQAAAFDHVCAHISRTTAAWTIS